jgi:CO/xanthine dehydrogenase Mo-binding subunit
VIGTNRYIGSPVERIEDPRFLRGRGQFVGDLKRDGMLHAAILRSPVAHGRVIGIDASSVHSRSLGTVLGRDRALNSGRLDP